MKQPLYIDSIGSLYFDGTATDAQPELKPLVQEHCRGKYRRIDRFTQLALIGAARCAAGLSLPVDTPLYLASGKGPAGNNIEMQHAIVAQHEPPKPIQFINAVSNSVSFYVMQDNLLVGQNLFVSREQHAFEAALTLASLDIEAGRAQCALLGMVDELTHPLMDQRARLGVAADTPLGEGSHWFVFQANRTQNSLGAVLDNVFFIGLPKLLAWLSGIEQDCELFFAHEVGSDTIAACVKSVSSGSDVQTHTENLWDGLTAGAVAGFLVASQSSDQDSGEEKNQSRGQIQYLVTISCDRDNRYHALLCQRL